MPYVDDLQLPQVTVNDAIAVAGWSLDDFKNRSLRKPPLLHLSREERKKGLRLTIARVVQMALIRELERLGVQARRAAVAAFHFSDTGSETEQKARPARDRCELFAKGRTLLLVFPDDLAGYVVNDTDLLDFGSLRGFAGKMSSSFIVVNCNEIVARVRKSLGLP